MMKEQQTIEEVLEMELTLDELEVDEQELKHNEVYYNQMLSDQDLDKLDSSIDDYQNDWFDLDGGLLDEF